VREARGLDAHPGPLLVIGPLADVLARSLAEGAGDAGLVSTAGEVRGASALVVVIGGSATGVLPQLREASSAHVPIVAVQMTDAKADIPYVLAQDVVEVPPAQGFPVDRIALALADALGRDAVPLAARLPVLRSAVEARRFRAAVVQSGLIAAVPWSAPRHFPLLAVAQARMLMELDVASGRPRGDDARETAIAAGIPVVSAIATGVAARTLYRRLPVGGRLTAGAVAVLGTVAVRAVGRAAVAQVASEPT
jgi:hypothetical protein